MENTLRERIALGECVSSQGTERCPVCIDRCEAFLFKVEQKQLKESLGIISNEFKSNNDEN